MCFRFFFFFTCSALKNPEGCFCFVCLLSPDTSHQSRRSIFNTVCTEDTLAARLPRWLHRCLQPPGGMKIKWDDSRPKLIKLEHWKRHICRGGEKGGGVLLHLLCPPWTHQSFLLIKHTQISQQHFTAAASHSSWRPVATRQESHC